MSTVDRLRSDIDSGRTRDKVAASDPAAAPLGTDEEAAGHPVPAEAVELARAHEVSAPRERRAGGALVYTAAVAAIMTIIVAGIVYFADAI